MLLSIPERVTSKEMIDLLPEYKERIEQICKSFVEPEYYDVRGVALYGVSECVRAERTIELLKQSKYKELGELMKISHNGDRIGGARVTDELLKTLIKENRDVAYECGKYDCSTEQIDELCDILNATDGVLGSEIAGAGLGGCVVALVEKAKADKIIALVNEKYYDKYGYEYSAYVYNASHGSVVLF